MRRISKTTLLALLSAFALAGNSPLSSSAAETPTPSRKIVTKAKVIVLPEFKLEGVTLTEAVHLLKAAGIQHDSDNKGVNFIVTDTAVATSSPKITLALKKVTLADATERLAEAAGVRVSAESYAFVFSARPSKQ